VSERQLPNPAAVVTEFGKAEAFFELLRDDPDGREGIRKESSSNPDQFQKIGSGSGSTFGTSAIRRYPAS
jgi:hypothetical protein